MSDEKIKVKDSRLFNADGSIKDDKQIIEETGNSGPLPEIDFQTFILSLASSAQISMGVVPNPLTGHVSKEMTHAKQSIDIIGMLEEKTKNNLTPEESGLLKHMLFQLRMQFVELNKKDDKKS